MTDNDAKSTTLSEVEGGNALLALMSEGDDFSESEQNSPEPRPAKKAAAPAQAEEPEPQQEEEEDTQAEPEEEADPSEDEVESEPEEEAEDEVPATRKVKVTIGGVDEWVTEEELKSGYMKGKDYTQKRQADAAAAKAAEADHQAVKAERQRIAADLGSLEQILKTANGAEPDWDTLRQGDLSVFTATFADWQLKQKQIEGVQKMKSEADQKVAEDRIREHNALVDAEAGKLTTLIPSWKDGKVAKRELGDIVKFAKEGLGYSDADIAQVTDARVFVMLRKAMLHDKASAPAVKDKIAKVRTAVPGTPAAPAARGTKAFAQAKARVAKSGSVEDGAAALLHLL